MLTTHVRVPAEDRRLQLIEVSQELFAARGFEGTTTRELAERAGVNEALIFRHFPTKEELYWAVLDHMISRRGSRERLRAHIAAGLPERETLMAIAEEILRRDLQLTRLLFFSVLEKHELSDRFFKTHVIEYHEIVAEYIRKGIREGRFRAVDPKLAARSFIGMFAHHFQLQELFSGKRYQRFDTSEVVETFVETWLRGMQPDHGQSKNLPGRAGEKAER